MVSTVTSAEAQKNFGRYRERALAERVVVTQYGTFGGHHLGRGI
jgi:hypothetical protein